MKRYVIGDIHGAHIALLQCLERSGFDSDQDLLISLGDICDGWPEVNQTIEQLLQLKHFKLILGNHDEWSLRWMLNGWRGREWTSQGGEATLASYQNDGGNVPQAHINLLQNATLYYELDSKLFVHGGIDPDIDIVKQDPQLLMWDRDLFHTAKVRSDVAPEHKFGKWNDIFIGHTTTEVYKTFKPMHFCNVWALDTGGGWSGKLTIMDIDSHAYWQSDFVASLYPHIPGRR